jgi:hypothetical protein
MGWGAIETLDLIPKALSKDAFLTGRYSIIVLAFEKYLLQGLSVLCLVCPAR